MIQRSHILVTISAAQRVLKTKDRSTNIMISAVKRIRYLLKMGNSPVFLLKEINQYLCKNFLKRFPVSLFSAVLDERRQTLCYSIYGEELTCFISLPNI